MDYKVKNGQTVYDVVNAIYKDLSFIYLFLSENPIITSVDFNLDTIPNLIVIFNPDNILSIPAAINLLPPPTEITKKEFSAYSGMSIYDICLQVYGSLDLLYQLMADSNFNNLQSEVVVGEKFIFNPGKTVDNIFANFLKTTKKIITTLVFTPSDALLQENGYYILQENGDRILL